MNDVTEHLKAFLDAAPDAEDVEAMWKFLKDSERDDLVKLYEALLAQRPPPPPTTEAAQPMTIGRAGHAWNDEEQVRRLGQMPTGVAIEIHDGKLLASDADRRRLAGMLLENMGMVEVIRLGDPEVWLEAFMECTALGAGLAVALDVFTHRKSSNDC